jgi:hypothetical protein
MNDNINLITGFRLRIILLLAVRLFFYFSTIIGFTLGICILILRVTLLVQQTYLFWSLLIFVPVVLLSVLYAVLKAPSKKTLKSLFDTKNKCGGLLIASEEVNLGFWESRISNLSRPKIRWKNRKMPGLFILAVIFVVAGFLVPQKYVQIVSARPMKIGEDLDKLTEQVDTLKNEDIIQEKTAEELKQALEEVKNTATGNDPVKTWETLDHIQQNLKKQAQDAASQALSQTENLAKAEALSQALSESGAELSSKVSAEAMSELSAMVKSLAGENEKLKESLEPNTLKACELGKLESSQLNELKTALQLSKQNISSSLSKMCQAGMIDVNTLNMCQALAQCDANSLKECMAKDANAMSVSQMLSQACAMSGSNPGRGGVDRGRADAAMTWKEESSEQGAKFTEKVLPPASLNALKDSITVNVSVSAPVVEKNAQSTATNALGSAASGMGQSFTQKILPKHRGAVKRYFEREQK